MKGSFAGYVQQIGHTSSQVDANFKRLSLTLQLNKREKAMEEIPNKFREPSREAEANFKLSVQDHRLFPNLLEDAIVIEPNFRHIITVRVLKSILLHMQREGSIKKLQ